MGAIFHLWEEVIAPILEAADARRIVEIGALRGRTTARLLGRLGQDSELHVVDPAPDFDPASHEAEFPGRYFFHRDLSLAVLPGLGPVDAALVDGDHNWFTVHGELHAFADTADATGTFLPVLLLHDVGWPHGRRDQYYDVEQIPEQHRQPNELERPTVPGEPAVWRAIGDGGPRNGVLCALEDFLAGTDRALRVVILPIYYGLAIIAECGLLAERPALAALLDRLESADGRAGLLRLAEQLRIKQLLVGQFSATAAERRAGRLRTGYLDLLVRALAGGDPVIAARLRAVAEAADRRLADAVPGDLGIGGAADPKVVVTLAGVLRAWSAADRALVIERVDGVAAYRIQAELAALGLLDETELVLVDDISRPRPRGLALLLGPDGPVREDEPISSGAAAERS